MNVQTILLTFLDLHSFFRYVGAKPSLQKVSVDGNQQGLDRALLRLDNEVRRLGMIPSHAMEEIVSKLPFYREF